MKIFIKIITLLFLMKSTCAFAQIAYKAEKICPVKIGEKINDASVLIKPNGNEVKFKKIIKGKPTLLIIYRGAWCPYCNKHLLKIQKIKKQILALGYQIVAISVDGYKKGKNIIKKNNLKYNIYFDPTTEFIQSLGVAFRASGESKPLLKNYSGGLNKESAIPVPCVFILDTKGVVAFSYINIDYTVRFPKDLIIKSLKEYNITKK